MNLTDKKLARLLPAFPERAEVRDPAFKGLVYRGSRRSAQIVLRRTVGGTRQRITLGEWPAIPLDTARAQAAQVLSVWTSEGAAAATRTTRTTTLSDVIGAWEEAHIENRRTNERARDIRKIFSGLLEQDVFALDTPHYLMTADEYRSRAPIHTRSVIRDLRSVLAWGAERDLCPEGCLQAVKLPKPEARDHTPTLEEMGIAWRALGRLDSDAVPILRLIMLTAFRNGEARAAEWRWLNSKTGVLTIPAEIAKVKKPVPHPLGETALSLIRDTGQRTGVLFPRADGSTHKSLATAHKNWMRLCAEEDEHFRRFRIHDIRRGFASNLSDMGWDAHAIELALSHSPTTILGSVGAIYNRAQRIEDRRRLANAWAETLSA